MRHGAIVDKVVTNLRAKFDYYRLRNEKVLVLWTSRNNKNPNKKTTFVAIGDPFPGTKINSYTAFGSGEV